MENATPGFRLVLAPLHGVTGLAFRKAYFASFRGFDACVAPFILAAKVKTSGQKHLRELEPERQARLPLVPQLLGDDAEAFVATAAALAGSGYREVNWNLGCPYPMVTKKGRGAGLLPHPDRVDRFLDEVVPRLGTSLSVKVRLGLGSPDEILELMPVLARYPLVSVTIHARLGIQMYRGAVDLDGFARAAESCPHPVAYNGDLRDEAAFDALRARFPSVREWMVGRWALYDPFLPARLKRLAPDPDPSATLRTFHDDLYALYREALSGPGHVLSKMKEAWTYFGRSLACPARALEALARAKGFADYEAAAGAALADGYRGSPAPAARGR
ncbi:MAG: tRNA-dihydrouridine synthase family protein [Spirochaetales bacterium]|nr:tRNA-dihydrouridine synthase family protein [Spirochaetales bacterium]